MMAQLSGSSIVTWLLYLVIAIGVMAVLETVFRESLPRWGASTGLRIWTYIIELAFLSSLATAPLLDKAHWPTAVLFHTLPVLAVLIYFIPTAIAIERSSQRLELIFFANLLVGWTVAGWFWALAKSFGDAHREQAQIVAQVVAERLAPPPPQRGPFITPDMFTREQPRYFVGKGMEQRAEEASLLADQPQTRESAPLQSKRRRAGMIFGRPVAGVAVAAPPSGASAAKTPVTTN